MAGNNRDSPEHVQAQCRSPSMSKPLLSLSVVSFQHYCDLRDLLNKRDFKAVCGSVCFPAIQISKATQSKNMKCSKIAVRLAVVGSRRPWVDTHRSAVWPTAWPGSLIGDTATVSAGTLCLARGGGCALNHSPHTEKGVETWGLMQASVMLGPAAWDKIFDFLALLFGAGQGCQAEPCPAGRDGQVLPGLGGWGLPLLCASRWGEGEQPKCTKFQIIL